MLFRLQIILNEIIMWNGNILFQDFLLMGQKTSNKWNTQQVGNLGKKTDRVKLQSKAKSDVVLVK